MKDQIEKQAIEEMAEDLNTMIGNSPKLQAEKLHANGYRKQIAGEWTRVEVNGKNYAQVYYQHKECEVNETQLFPSPHHFCPNCGAKMKGGAE